MHMLFVVMAACKGTSIVLRPDHIHYHIRIQQSITTIKQTLFYNASAAQHLYIRMIPASIKHIHVSSYSIHMSNMQ